MKLRLRTTICISYIISEMFRKCPFDVKKSKFLHSLKNGAWVSWQLQKLFLNGKKPTSTLDHIINLF